MAERPAPSIGALRGAVDLAPLVARQHRDAQAAARPADGAGEQPRSNLVFEIPEADFGQAVELSKTVPVLVALVATWSSPSQDLLVALRRAVEGASGRLVLAIVDADASPRIAQAFQAQSVPTTVALVAGGPVPLFAGVLPDDQLGPLLDQLLELAAQHGVTGSVPQEGAAPAAAAAEPEPAPLPPLHVEAYDAIDRGEYGEAARLFRTAIAQNPRDDAAVAALAQVELLERMQLVQPDTEDPLELADRELAAGQVQEAFDRLLAAFAAAKADDRTAIRTRLLDYFTLTGTEDPRVVAARRRLAALLY